MLQGEFFQNPGSSAAFYPYQIQKSCRFRRNDNDGLNRTLGSPTNNDILTLSCWMKRNLLGNYYMNIYHAHTGSNGHNIAFDNSGTDDTIGISSSLGGDGTSLYRDTKGWTNFVMAWDTTQGSNNDRFKFFVNGVERDEYNASISQNANVVWNTSGNAFYIGRNTATGYTFDGYMTEIIGVDGQQLAPTAFGELVNGVWRPIDYAGTYGNNGFRLQFLQTGTSADASGIGADTSGNGNHFALNNITADHVVLDSPTFGS